MIRNDVIVIGGGISGLATGALLAKRGLRTLVLEKGNSAGGRAYAYEDKGFTLNYGAHAMYRPESGLLAEVMRRLDRSVPRCSYPDPVKSFWADGDRWGSLGTKPHQAATSKLFPLASKARLGAMMLTLRTAKPESVPADMTWGDWIDAHTSDPLLRRFLRALTVVNTYSAAPDTLSARGVLRHLKENMFVRDYAGYMHGGWGVMFDEFIEEIIAGGGAIVTGARVDSLEVRDGAVTAAIAGGERYEASAFVSTLPPQDAPALAEPATPLARELAGWEGMQDVRAIAFDVGLNRRVRTDLTFAFDVERSLYYSIHSDVAQGLAPEGSQLIHSLAYLTPDDAASDAAVERRYGELMTGFDRFFPGWRDAVVVERTIKNARVVAARRTPEQYAPGGVPARSSVAPNLHFVNDARDVPYFLSLASLAAAIEVSDTIAAEQARAVEMPAPVAAVV